MINEDIVRRFIVNEGAVPVATIASHSQILDDILAALTPHTQGDARRITVAKEHVAAIRRLNRQNELKVKELEESQKK